MQNEIERIENIVLSQLLPQAEILIDLKDKYCKKIVYQKTNRNYKDIDKVLVQMQNATEVIFDIYDMLHSFINDKRIEVTEEAGWGA